MAPNPISVLTTMLREDPNTHAFCSIIPLRLLQHTVNIGEVPEKAKFAAQKTLNHVHKLQQKAREYHAFKYGDNLSDRKLQCALDLQHHLENDGKMRENICTKWCMMQIERTIFLAPRSPREKNNIARIALENESAQELSNYFRNTFSFFFEVFGRNSIDDQGLDLIGRVIYDDKPGPPGMDNAFWDGTEMAIGDGDNSTIGSFTKNLDVIGHEPTHGVTSFEVDLKYEHQSGALNADWLIGENIFLPSVENAEALRFMKAPGTAYNNPQKIGKDPQPADMEGSKNLPNTAAGD